MTNESTTEKATYDFADIEPRWQRFWEDSHVFRQPNHVEPGLAHHKPK